MYIIQKARQNILLLLSAGLIIRFLSNTLFKKNKRWMKILFWANFRFQITDLQILIIN